MGNAGCVVTCIAIIKGKSPKDLNDEYNEIGAYNSSGELIWGTAGVHREVIPTSSINANLATKHIII